MKLRPWLCVLVAVAGALVLRSVHLGLRPVHNDEAVNGFILGKITETGRYEYNPLQFHGPALYYFALPFVCASGARNFSQLTETTLRAVPAAIGVGLVLVVLLLRDGLGHTATATAAVLVAISPAMVFYSRYFIHETLLVFFTALTLGAGWRWIKTRQVGWALLCGAGLGLMHATKETSVLAIGAMLMGGIFTGLLASGRAAGLMKLFDLKTVAHGVVAIVAAVLVSVSLFSSFYTHPAGVIDSVRSLWFWLGHAGAESPHTHPWHFYLSRLLWYRGADGHVWTEGLIVVLGLFGMICPFVLKELGAVNRTLGRFLALYTLVLGMIYSVIPYKTPWCVLSFLHGMTLLGGIGTAVLFSIKTRPWTKLVLMIFLGGAMAHLCWETVALNFKYFAHRTNPYAYAQTVPDVLRLVETLERIARIEPNGARMVIKVMAPEHDYWPLPWYLRRFQTVGWWDRIPEDPFAPVMVVSTQFNAVLDKRSDGQWLMVGLFELRSGVFFELYVEAELWRACVSAGPTQSG